MPTFVPGLNTTFRPGSFTPFTLTAFDWRQFARAQVSEWRETFFPPSPFVPFVDVVQTAPINGNLSGDAARRFNLEKEKKWPPASRVEFKPLPVVVTPYKGT